VFWTVVSLLEAVEFFEMLIFAQFGTTSLPNTKIMSTAHRKNGCSLTEHASNKDNVQSIKVH